MLLLLSNFVYEDLIISSEKYTNLMYMDNLTLFIKSRMGTVRIFMKDCDIEKW